jgi:hypothetical protein
MEAMKSVVIKRSVALAGHKTSVSLEDAFWKGLKEIARAARHDIVGPYRFDRQRSAPQPGDRRELSILRTQSPKHRNK